MGHGPMDLHIHDIGWVVPGSVESGSMELYKLGFMDFYVYRLGCICAINEWLLACGSTYLPPPPSSLRIVAIAILHIAFFFD